MVAPSFAGRPWAEVKWTRASSREPHAFAGPLPSVRGRHSRIFKCRAALRSGRRALERNRNVFGRRRAVVRITPRRRFAKRGKSRGRTDYAGPVVRGERMSGSKFVDVRMRGFQQRAEVAAVLALLEARTAPLPGEAVPLREAAGRVLAEPVVSAVDVPGFARRDGRLRGARRGHRRNEPRDPVRAGPRRRVAARAAVRSTNWGPAKRCASPPARRCPPVRTRC